MNQGGGHVSLHMVGLYKVARPYILENNQYAMGTAVSRVPGARFVLKAKEPGIAGER